MTNKDIEILQAVVPTMQAIEMLEQQMEWERDRLACISRYPTGMPSAGARQDGLEKSFAVIGQIESEHAESCALYRRQLKKALRVIRQIDSPLLRSFVTMRYVFGISDVKIREGLNLTRRGFDRAKAAVEDAQCMREVRWKERYITEAEEDE